MQRFLVRSHWRKKLTSTVGLRNYNKYTGHFSAKLCQDKVLSSAVQLLAMKLLRALPYCLFYNRVYPNIVRLLMILGEHFTAAKSFFPSSQQFCSATKTGKQPLPTYLAFQSDQGIATLSKPNVLVN